MKHCYDVNMPSYEVTYINQAACLSIVYKSLWDSEVVYYFLHLGLYKTVLVKLWP